MNYYSYKHGEIAYVIVCVIDNPPEPVARLSCIEEDSATISYLKTLRLTAAGEDREFKG